MKVPFQQKLPWGCGHFAISNLFNDERYLSHIEEETASFVIDLNKSLQEFSVDGLWISTIFCVQSQLPVQNRFIDTALFGLDFENISSELKDTAFRPFLVVVKLTYLSHMIAVVHCLKNDLFYIVDSLREDVLKMTKEEFIMKYYVVEIFHFENKLVKESCKRGQESQTLFFSYDYYNHLQP